MGSPQLKFLQAALQACDGVFGARFSGAGTRGACVALVQPAQAASIAARVQPPPPPSPSFPLTHTLCIDASSTSLTSHEGPDVLLTFMPGHHEREKGARYKAQHFELLWAILG